MILMMTMFMTDDGYEAWGLKDPYDEHPLKLPP